jgi:Ala-tRNA(Pro) deacylase
MPAAPEDLFAHLDRLGIAHATTSHRPVFTVEDGADLKAQMPGGHTKNLFLADRAGRLALVCALGHTRVALNRLHRAIGHERMSFGSAEALFAALGVRPGSVTLFALINDAARAVTLVLDEALLAHEIVNFHPLANDATTAIAARAIAPFVTAWGGRAFAADFSGEEPRVRPFPLAQSPCPPHVAHQQGTHTP